MRKASTCLCLFSLSYITITPVLPIPSWRRKLATEFLKYLAVRVRATHPHGTVNHFPHHVICVLSHRYNHLRLPLLKYITTRRNSNSHCQTGNRLHTAPNSFSYLGGVFSINDFTPLHISISFSYYYICCITCINTRPNTWRHTIKVTSLSKLALCNTPLTALL